MLCLGKICKMTQFFNDSKKRHALLENYDFAFSEFFF